MAMTYKPPEWSGPLKHDIFLEFVVGGSVVRKQQLPIGKEYFLVGRHAKQCDVVLDAVEPKASRVHAVLQCKEDSDELFVYDLGSTHGTLLNNKRIEPQTHTPVAVGHQLRFSSEGSQCLVLVCGPEELMEEEGEVDLTELREEAQRERLAADQDLARRKRAKKERMMKEKSRQAVAEMYAEKARKKQEIMQEELEKDRTKLHEVRWGMDEDAVEVTGDGLTEEAEKVLDKASDNSWIDPEKVRNFKKLTEKQEQMVAKFEQKKRKLEALQKEKMKLEGRIKKNAMQASSFNEDTEFDPLASKPDRSGPVSSEQHARVEQKLITIQEDVVQESDKILISLGLKTAEMSEKQKKERAQMYDTNVMTNEDDDFFDRTAAPRKGNNSQTVKRSANDEFSDLPQIGKDVETKESLQQKVKLLQSERAHLEAKIAMTDIAIARYGATKEDSLDAFMMGNEQKLVVDRLAKLKVRQTVVKERLGEAMKMLTVAERNSSGEASVASVVAAAAAAAVAKKSKPPPAKSTAPVASKPNTEKTVSKTVESGDKASKAEVDTTDVSVTSSSETATQAQAAEENNETDTEPVKKLITTPVIGKRVYGQGTGVHIDPNRAGIQHLADPPVKRQKPGPAPPSSVSASSVIQDPVTAKTASPANPQKRRLGPTMPPPGALQGAQDVGEEPKAQADGEMPPPAPPKKKVYGVARPPVGVSSERDSEEHFE